MTNVAANAAIGAAVALVRTALGAHPAGHSRTHSTMRSALRSAWPGAVGGALQSVGRQVAAGRLGGGGLIGREVAAAGVSLTYSAGSDSTIVLGPLGPLTFELRPRAERRVRIRLNAFDAVAIVSAALDRHTSFDLPASLSHGAVVFRRPQAEMPFGDREAGFTQVGTILVAREYSRRDREAVLRHESVHLLQWDAYNQLLALPAERVVLGSFAAGRAIRRVADIGVLAPLTVYFVARLAPYDRQPWEREAHILTTGRPVRERD